MGCFVGSQKQRARSILFRRERCNNNTEVVTSVLDTVVYEDDRAVCEIDKCYAHTRDVVGYILVVCRKEGPTELVERMAKSAPQTRSEMEAARERFLVW